MKSLHQSLFLHCHINLRSVLITPKGQIKLSSFDSSQKYDFSHFPQPDSQDKAYLAPELLLGQPYHTFSSDMWSVGCVFYFMLAGYSPFAEDSQIAILFRIFKTLGTPNMLDYPAISGCPLFFENYDKFPMWAGMDFDELIPQASYGALDLLKRIL